MLPESADPLIPNPQRGLARQPNGGQARPLNGVVKTGYVNRIPNPQSLIPPL